MLKFVIISSLPAKAIKAVEDGKRDRKRQQNRDVNTKTAVKSVKILLVVSLNERGFAFTSRLQSSESQTKMSFHSPRKGRRVTEHQSQFSFLGNVQSLRH